MKSDKSLLMKVGLGIAAVFALWLVADTYFRVTSGTRDADEVKKQLEENYRKIDKATQERKDQERGKNP